MSSDRAAPWKAINHIGRVLGSPIIRVRFKIAGVHRGGGWNIFGMPIIQRHRDSAIRIGDRLNLRSTVRSNPLAPNHPVVLSTREPGALLVIGDDFAMTGGSIVAAERITIGDRVTVGANCVITDTDFHPIDPNRRRVSPLDAVPAPVVIGNDVFIGTNTIILKGVTIGPRSTIGAGSVVTRNIPGGVVAAGNPVKVIRKI